MDTLTASRLVRELEAQDRFADADRVRWAVACAVTCPVSPCEPAATPEADLESDASDPLGPALRDAEACEDWPLVGRLLSALAVQQRPSRRAA